MGVLLFQSTALEIQASVVVVHGLSCLGACGIFPDQGSNPSPLHWLIYSQPLDHQGSLVSLYLKPTEVEFSICWYAHLKRQGLLFNYWLSVNGGSALLLLLFQSYSTVTEKVVGSR